MKDHAAWLGDDRCLNNGRPFHAATIASPAGSASGRIGGGTFPREPHLVGALMRITSLPHIDEHTTDIAAELDDVRRGLGEELDGAFSVECVTPVGRP